MLFVQITDTHIVEKSDDPTLSLAAQNLYGCIAEINRMDPQPDLVIHSGDLVQAGHPVQYDHVREILDTIDAPLFIIPGNHDERGALADAFPHHAYLPPTGFMQYTVEDFPVRLIGVDSVIAGEKRGGLCAERLAWLDDQLSRNKSQPTVLFMHHPPYEVGIEALDWQRCTQGADELNATVRRHTQVERILSGHTHRATFVRWAGTVATTAPSTARPLALELRKGKGLVRSRDLPAYQLHAMINGNLVTHTLTLGA